MVEVRVGHEWEVLDPTGSRRAPRWCASPPAATPPTPRSPPPEKKAELTICEVSAVSDGDLPADDHRAAYGWPRARVHVGWESACPSAPIPTQNRRDGGEREGERVSTRTGTKVWSSRGGRT